MTRGGGYPKRKLSNWILWRSLSVLNDGLSLEWSFRMKWNCFRNGTFWMIFLVAPIPMIPWKKAWSCYFPTSWWNSYFLLGCCWPFVNGSKLLLDLCTHPFEIYTVQILANTEDFSVLGTVCRLYECQMSIRSFKYLNVFVCFNYALWWIHFTKQIIPFKSSDFYLLDSFRLGLVCKLHTDKQLLQNNFCFVISATICWALVRMQCVDSTLPKASHWILTVTLGD